MSGRLATSDVETENWDEFRLAAVATDDGERHVFHDRRAWATWLRKFDGRVVMHYGGRFDFLFLPPLTSIVMSGSGILSAQHGAARLYDSWFLFQMSLARIGKAIGHQKMDVDRGRIEDLTAKECADYCVDDCEILLEALQNHRSWAAAQRPWDPKWPPTAGGTAVYVAESLEPWGPEAFRSAPLSIEEWMVFRQAVNGGRVEIRHMGATEKTFCYDINSSYPTAWGEGDFPVGPWTYRNHVTDALFGIYRVEVRQNRNHLPIVSCDFCWKYDGEAFVTREELDWLHQTGAQVKVIEAWETDVGVTFGSQFAARLYEAKQAGDPWAKVSINSLHGKFGQDIFQEKYFLNGAGDYVMDIELQLPRWYQRPAVGAYNLARARIRLWRAMDALIQAGYAVYYCDTDSIYTDCPPEHFPAPIGDAMGEWKLEGVCSRAVFAGPKVYALEYENGDPSKVVAKGQPVGKVDATGKLLLGFDEIAKVSRGGVITNHLREGVLAFRSVRTDWRSEAREFTRTLQRQFGGKVLPHGHDSGTLCYPDA